MAAREWSNCNTPDLVGTAVVCVTSKLYTFVSSSFYPSSANNWELGCGGNSILSRDAQTSLAWATSSSKSDRTPKCFLGQLREISPSVCPGSSLGPPLDRTCSEHLLRVHTAGIRNRWQSHWSWPFWMQGSSSDPPRLLLFLSVRTATLRSPLTGEQCCITIDFTV